jgi:hypothetical protein
LKLTRAVVLCGFPIEITCLNLCASINLILKAYAIAILIAKALPFAIDIVKAI